MTARDEQSAGYCVSCGDYVLGRFVRVINSNADAVDGHQGFTGRRRPAAEQPEFGRPPAQGIGEPVEAG